MAGVASGFTEPPLLLIPGPTPVPRRVLAALAEPTQAHNSPTAAAALRRLQAGLRHCLGHGDGPEAPAVLVSAGSGTSAMESALVNLVAPGEPVVVVTHGYFGERFCAIARAHGAVVTEVAGEWGERVPASAVEEALERSQARVVTATHVDTANGVASQFTEYAAAARRHDAVLVLDAVASAGGMPLEMATSGVDVVVTASQKALAMPPGLGFNVVSPRALERRRQQAGGAGYYLDWLSWVEPMADPVGRYFATLPTNLIVAGAVAVEIAEEEGWSARFARHRRMARAVRRALRALGLENMCPEDALGATVSALAVPEGITPAALRAEVGQEGVAIAGGLGRWGDQVIRIGHMGATSLPELLIGIAALEQALLRLGAPVEQGAGVAELLCGWEAAEGE